MQKFKWIMAGTLLLTCTACFGQDQQSAQLIGGRCEGCEAVFEFGEQALTPVDTLPDFHSDGPKLKYTGTIYQADGKTPAANVIIYIYHTDQTGIYPTRGDETDWARRHGFLRGWAITGSDGRYTFYTLKPATYPSRTEPAHIHITLLEPDGKYYWLDATLFEGDSLLDSRDREIDPRGGGNRILRLSKEGNLLIGTRDIVLGKNVPGYE